MVVHRDESTRHSAAAASVEPTEIFYSVATFAMVKPAGKPEGQAPVRIDVLSSDGDQVPRFYQVDSLLVGLIFEHVHDVHVVESH